MDATEGKKTPIQRLKNTSSLINDMGKLPPQAIDVEQVVLGAMMLEKDAVDNTIDILNEHSFYDPKHRIIFKTIHSLFASTSPIDLVTVSAQLQKIHGAFLNNAFSFYFRLYIKVFILLM